MTADALISARHRQHEAIKRGDGDSETLRSIGCRYNASAATISRLTP
jgi:hypothetical protein